MKTEIERCEFLDGRLRVWFYITTILPLRLPLVRLLSHFLYFCMPVMTWSVNYKVDSARNENVSFHST